MPLKLQSEWATSQRYRLNQQGKIRSPEGEVEVEGTVPEGEGGTMISAESAAETAVTRTDAQESIQYQTKVALIGK